MLVLILVLGAAGSGCGAGLDARAVQGGLLGAAGGGLIGAGAGAIGGTLVGAQIGRCEDDPSQCQQAQAVYYRGGWGRHHYPHGGGHRWGGQRHYYPPRHGNFGWGRRYYYPPARRYYGGYEYGGGRISCNYRCESWDAGCQRERGQCEGDRRALEEQARDEYDYARERAYCRAGGRNCRPRGR